MSDRKYEVHKTVAFFVATILSTLVMAWIFFPAERPDALDLGSKNLWGRFWTLLFTGAIWVGLWCGFGYASLRIALSLDPSEREERRQRELRLAKDREAARAKESERRAEEHRLWLEEEAKLEAEADAKLWRDQFDTSICEQFELELVQETPSDTTNFRLTYHGELLDEEAVTVSASIDLLDEHGQLIAPPGSQMGWRMRATFTAKKLVAINTIHDTPPEVSGFRVWSCTVHDFVSPHRTRP